MIRALVGRLYNINLEMAANVDVVLVCDAPMHSFSLKVDFVPVSRKYTLMLQNTWCSVTVWKELQLGMHWVFEAWEDSFSEFDVQLLHP